MNKLLLFTITAIVAFGLMGCETMPETNSNKVVVTDETNVNVDGAKTDNEIVDGDWTWDGDIDRETYDKDKDKYAKQRGEKYKDDTVGSGVNDAWLWTKTRASLATTEGVRETTINVDVTDEVVTLKGTVGSEKEKTDAVKVAKEIEGVKSVKDELKVAKDDSMTNMNTSDDDKDSKDEKANTKTEKK